jgi:hypothetical protein
VTAFVQSKSAFVLSGTSVSVTLPSPTTAGNLIVAVASWFDATNFSATNSPKSLTLKDSALNPLAPFYSHNLSSSGDLQVTMFSKSPVAGGLTGFTATAPSAGAFFLSVHEVAPDTGEILYLNSLSQTEANSGDTALTFTAPFVNNGYTGNSYNFVSFAENSEGDTPTTSTTGFTERESAVNATPIDTGSTTTGGAEFFWFGSLTTFDKLGASLAYPALSFPSIRWKALGTVAQFVSMHVKASTPVATPGPGTYPTAQSVVLTNAESLAIYYTLDGSTPTTSSTLYSSPISVAHPLTLKAFAHDATATYDDSTVLAADYHIYTGQCLNPGNIIDGNDTTFCDLICAGSTGDEVLVLVEGMTGNVGGGGANLVVDYEITQNDLVAATQTIPAWKVAGWIGSTETVLDSAGPGGGAVARQTKVLAIPSGTNAASLAARIAAACQIPGSTGGLHLKIYAAYLECL